MIEKIVKEILKTGFPLELYVIDVCSKRNTGRMPNIRYMYEGILREIDLHAFFETNTMEPKKRGENFQYTSTSMIIECKKSEAKPWVFFSSHIHQQSDCFYFAKYVSDFDLYFRSNQTYSLLGQIHKQVPSNHYRDKTTSRCITYFECFKNHSAPSEIYKGIESVLSFLCYQRHERLKTRDKVGAFSNFFFPVLVLDGLLYEASIDQGSVAVKEQQHIQLRTDYNNEIFIIDVVTKQYFDKFFERVAQDHQEFVDAINKIHFPVSHKTAIKAKHTREMKELETYFPIDFFAEVTEAE
jgi:hypothetical protein